MRLNKNTVLRRIIFFVLLLLSFVLQSTPGLFPAIFGARAFLLIPLVICVSMNERSFAGVIICTLSGVLWDMSSGADGFNTLLMFVFSLTSAVLINYVCRNNIITALVLCAGSLSVYITGYVLLSYAPYGVTEVGALLLGYYLPCGLYSLVLTAPMYYLIKAINIFTALPGERSRV